jgi:hypothetical protein
VLPAQKPEHNVPPRLGIHPTPVRPRGGRPHGGKLAYMFGPTSHRPVTSGRGVVR